MNDIVAGCRVEGEVRLDGRDIYAAEVDVVKLRSTIGMVFQKPNPFPKTIYENVAYGPRIHGIWESKEELDEVSSDIPVMIVHQSGHLATGNSAALALVGYDSTTENPAGGVIPVGC